MTVVYRSYVEYDPDAGVWFTEASTIPGLGASGKEVDKVVSSLNTMAPLMLRVNVFGRKGMPKYEGPSEIEHEVVVIERDGHALRRPTTKINVHSLT
jgi:hypothetical protein